MKKLIQTYQLTALGGLSLVAVLIFTQILALGFVNAMIAVHVILGSLAFLVGAIALMTKKGSRVHKVSGKWFYLLMVFSAIYTLIVSVMPFHISPSMFQISVMTLYFLTGGMRSIDFKQAEHNFFVDKLLAAIAILVSLGVMLYSVVLYGEFYPLRTVFGAVAISFGVADLVAIARFSSKNNANNNNANSQAPARKHWLIFHLSKMVAGYTTAATGFFVAQNILVGYYNWFTPTVICLIYILWWVYRLYLSKPKKHAVPKLAAS